MSSQRITESSIAETSLKVDREKGVIFGVKCLGRESKNGRTYSDRALSDAVNLYEGSEVNVDHPDGSTEDGGFERQMADGFGVLRSTSLRASGVFADLHYLKSHPLAEVIAERAERFPGHFGMSHVALGEMTETEPGNFVVEGLASVESVDIVRRPATNAGLFESTGAPNMAKTTTTETKKPTVREVLERNRKTPLAANLLLLCEEEEFAAVAEAPVAPEPTESSSGEDQIKAAFRSMIIAAVDDDKLDMAATVGKIKEILKAQEKLTAAPVKKDDPPDGGAMTESVELTELKRKIAIREALDDRGMIPADLTEAQRKVLGRSQEKQHAVDLLEAWEVGPEKPAVRPLNKPTSSTTGGRDYETLQEAADRNKDRAPARRR